MGGRKTLRFSPARHPRHRLPGKGRATPGAQHGDHGDEGGRSGKALRRRPGDPAAFPSGHARSLARTAPLPSPGSVRDGGRGAGGRLPRAAEAAGGSRAPTGWPARRELLPAGQAAAWRRCRRREARLGLGPAGGGGVTQSAGWEGAGLPGAGLVNSRRGAGRSGAGAGEGRRASPAQPRRLCPRKAGRREGRAWGEPSATIAAPRAAGMPSGPAPPCPETEPSPAAL